MFFIMCFHSSHVEQFDPLVNTLLRHHSTFTIHITHTFVNLLNGLLLIFFGHSNLFRHGYFTFTSAIRNTWVSHLKSCILIRFSLTRLVAFRFCVSVAWHSRTKFCKLTFWMSLIYFFNFFRNFFKILTWFSKIFTKLLIHFPDNSPSWNNFILF